MSQTYAFYLLSSLYSLEPQTFNLEAKIDVDKSVSAQDNNL